MLRLQHEGHDCDWFLLGDSPRQAERRILRGLVPAPLDSPPSDFSPYDLVIFDSTGNGELAEKIRKQTPVIGDGLLSQRLEDDRLYGIQVMQACGIEVPRYETFDSPDDARKWIEEQPKRYVYKPFTPHGEEQDCDTTYVSESSEDLIRSLDHLYEDSMHAPFLLQEVVTGEEISTEAYFDGDQFRFHNHTLEEKKFMAGGYGPNTGCAGNLVWTTNGPNRLFSAGLGRTREFLRDHDYRGMVDLNTIVNEHHCYGLEFTPRFGYDASASIFSTLSTGLGEFLWMTATGNPELEIRTKARWAASARYSIPPYPEDMDGKHPRGIPIKGVALEDAWHNFFLYDAMIDRNGDGDMLCTAGVNGLVGCPIACGYTPEGAWCGVERLTKELKIPNMQVRDDLQERTAKRLQAITEMGWLE
jgi:phosphoribosylamine-glycine ligase